MDRGLAVVITLFVGALTAIQPATNNMLSRHTGALIAALTSMVLAAVILLVFVILAGDLTRIGYLSHFRPVHVLGPIAGAAVVGGSIYLIRPLGATGLTAALVTGQLALSVAIDKYGWFGVTQKSIGISTIFGILLLATGTVLVATRG